MRILSTCTASLLILGMGMNLIANSEQQSTPTTDSSMAVKSVEFVPGHPDCSPKTVVAPFVAAPVVVAKPAPVIAKAEGDQDKDGVVDSMDKCPDTPRGYKVDPTGCPVSVDLRLHFAFNSSVIPVSDYPQVDKLAQIMKDNPPAKAVIVGHTDHTGTDEYNQKLSERRSKALGDRLIKDGIAADRITTSGKGEKEPMATNNTREGRALNRRIHVELH